MPKDKYPNIFSPQLGQIEAILIRSCDAFRPIARAKTFDGLKCEIFRTLKISDGYILGHIYSPKFNNGTQSEI